MTVYRASDKMRMNGKDVESEGQDNVRAGRIYEGKLWEITFVSDQV